MEVRQLVRDLIAMRVGMEVKDGRPILRVPATARAMVDSNLLAIRAAHDEIVRIWSEVAAELPPPKRCRECKAWVFCKPGADEGTKWSFCEFPYCPSRTDPEALAFRSDKDFEKNKSYEKWKTAKSRRAKFLADHPTATEVPE